MKAIRFLVPYFWDGAVRYAPGKLYPVTEETLRCVASGSAESIDVDGDVAAARDAATAKRTEASEAASAAAGLDQAAKQLEDQASALESIAAGDPPAVAAAEQPPADAAAAEVGKDPAPTPDAA